MSTGLSDKSDAQQGLKLSYDETKKALKIASIDNLLPATFDAIEIVNHSATEDLINYYTSGLTGTLVGSLLLAYTDGTKTVLVSVSKVL